jgi:hypothetical protein
MTVALRLCVSRALPRKRIIPRPALGPHLPRPQPDQASPPVKAIRISLHGLVLTVADIAGIVGGAVVAFRALGVSNQPGRTPLSPPLVLASEVPGQRMITR